MAKPKSLRLLPAVPTAQQPDFVVCLGSPPSYLDVRAREYFLSEGPPLVAFRNLLECDITTFSYYCLLRAEVDLADSQLAELAGKSPTARVQRQLQSRTARRARSAAALQKCAASLLIDVTSPK